MKKTDHLHPLLGPHEGRELELMLKGEKPAAMFHYVVGKEEHIVEDVFTAFQPYVDNGSIIKKEISYADKHSIRYVFYSLPTHTKNIDRLIEIKNHLYDSSRKENWPNELEKEIGQLLGYSNAAIKHYIEHKKNIKR